MMISEGSCIFFERRTYLQCKICDKQECMIDFCTFARHRMPPVEYVRSLRLCTKYYEPLSLPAYAAVITFIFLCYSSETDSRIDFTIKYCIPMMMMMVGLLTWERMYSSSGANASTVPSTIVPFRIRSIDLFRQRATRCHCYLLQTVEWRRTWNWC